MSDTSEEEVVDHHLLKNPGDQLLAAAVNGDAVFVKDLLDKTPALVNHKDDDGYTVLHRACYSAHSNILQICLDHIGIGTENSDLINTVTNDGWTPIHSASRWNSFECVQLLIEKGADVNIKSKGGNTPLHLAAECGEARETLTLLLAHPCINKEVVNSAGQSAFQIAQRRGKYAYLFSSQK